MVHELNVHLYQKMALSDPLKIWSHITSTLVVVASVPFDILCCSLLHTAQSIVAYR